MTTKAKCFALAAEHNLSISYGFTLYSKYSSVDLPDGFLDYDGRTGLYFEVHELSAKQFWREVYTDIQSVIMAKDKWTRIAQ